MTQGKARDDIVRAAAERFEKQLVRYARHLTGDLERARDVVQETFMRLCRAEPSEVRDHLAPWLYSVCRNLALDVVRKEARMTHLNEPLMDQSVSDAPAPPVVLAEAESRGAVLALIDTLPANQQEAIRLKFQQGLRYKEIAEVLETSVSNVGFLIHRGIKTVREQLSLPGPKALREV